MTVTAAQKTAIEEVIRAIVSVTAQRKRQLAGMFMVLVDRNDYPEYFDIIPEPRAIDSIRDSLQKNQYKDPLDVYMDLSLVFWNALYYNEPGSQISSDAEKLKKTLESEWSKRSSTLPQPRSFSPPPSSAQKIHKQVEGKTASTSGLNTAKRAVPATASTRSSSQVSATPVAPNSTLPVAMAAATSTNVDRDVDTMSDGQADDGNEGMGNDSNEGMGDGGMEEMERDGASDEIVKVLERSLPPWPGFEEFGWMEEGNNVKYMELVQAVKSHKDVLGNRLSTSLDNVPDQLDNPTATSTELLSLKIIETKIKDGLYTSPKLFDKDMMLLFEKSRRWYEIGTESYGRVLILQRLYQALTSVHFSPPSGPPYVSQTHFAALKAGPGNVRPVHSHSVQDASSSSQGNSAGSSRTQQLATGVTTHRVPTKDRNFVSEVNYKGWNIKLADWVHLSNPDDPSKPIIGQVFRCWMSEEESKRGQVGLTVSWYYRPEQTFHPPSRPFWDNEIFKTSHFADHPIPDLIEKIACQFTARHIRGRPKAPYWYPGWPLYVCDSRYNDRDRVFVRIKNWNSCIPEEMRKREDWMPIYGFERVVFPRRNASPFLSGNGKAAVKGPGGLLDEPAVDENDGNKSRSRRGGGMNAGDPGPSKGLFVGNTASHTGTTGQPGYGTLGTGGSGTGNSTLPTNYSVAAYGQTAYTGYPGYGYAAQQQSKKPTVDRTVLTAAGGVALGANAQVEKLTAELTRHFDRSPETNEMLWFPSPPSNVPRIPTPKYSLKYLNWLAKKRKRERGESVEEGADDVIQEDGLPNGNDSREAIDHDMDVDGAGPSGDGHKDSTRPTKRSRTTVPSLSVPERPKIKVPPTVTETLASFREELANLKKNHAEGEVVL
ncbi:hypothetical protein K435DRAFT_742310 [Dendrothele bispora CBS 962.96]|uniref:BAH-domain-containing protein n=1 Tax=Dendrothele bispora (strain CBS 962.96) TaxID=1314807 RepID=A0A4V4HIN5_DENBC|nr:hypothetical protein K435DRAFT_742310 [Dendrothele bispora CBS 962.96]